MKKNFANFITSLRILGTIVLAFLPTLNKQYLAVHVFTGVTDALDGYVARKTNTVSSFLMYLEHGHRNAMTASIN